MADGNAAFVDGDMLFADGNASFAGGDVPFADGNAAARTFGRAHRRRPYQPPSNPSSGNHSVCLFIGEPFAANHSARLLIGKLFAGNPFRWSTMRLKYCQLDVPKHGDCIEKAMKSR